MALVVGIDFDNTIAIYDAVFHRYAVSRFGMPISIPCDKPSIRNYFLTYTGGREDWIELQGIVYGTKMSEASLAPGLEDFLRGCLNHDVNLCIISHKTEYPARGPAVHLHKAAWKWLEDHQFLDPAVFGLTKDDVFFELRREKKLDRIAIRDCDIFIDDLPEVFNEPAFPKGVLKVMYDPAGRHPYSSGIKKCSCWKEVADVVFRENSQRYGCPTDC